VPGRALGVAQPLVVADSTVEALFWVACGAWCVGEVANSFRAARGASDARDPAVMLLSAALFGGLALGALAAYRVDDLVLPGPDWWPPLVGLALFAGGLALRIDAVRTLGRYFRYSVTVEPDQPVIDTGPYRLVRHPAYTGLLAAALGVGVALGNWLSIALCLIPPLFGFTLRLLSEERVLSEQLGEPYRAYMRRTKRLIPGVW
jgi:protein-S-isoprenylcysteine O-methyltransferase Ste14